jgi:hypothetical protein
MIVITPASGRELGDPLAGKADLLGELRQWLHRGWLGGRLLAGTLV